MATEKQITASCIITNNKVVKNGITLFEESGVGISDFLTAVYKYLQVQYPKFYKMDNLSKLGWLAAEVLLNSSFDKNKYTAEQIAIILANANASLDSDLKYLESVSDVASPALFVYTLPNIVIGEISIRNGFKGENAFYIMKDFDAAMIYRQVDAAMEHSATACICGWIDVLGNDYKAALFLIEHDANAITFSADHLNSLFEKN